MLCQISGSSITLGLALFWVFKKFEWGNKRIGSPALGCCRMLTLFELFSLFLLWLSDTKSSINFCLATKYLSLFFFFLHYLSLFLHSLYTTLRYDCYGTIERLVLSIFLFTSFSNVKGAVEFSISVGGLECLLLWPYSF